MNLTIKQQGIYWKAFYAACYNLGITDAKEQTAYRKRVMLEECNVDSMKHLNRTTDFDKVMMRFNEDSGNIPRAIEFALADDQRTAFLVAIVSEQVKQLRLAELMITDECSSPIVSTADYLNGILHNANIMTANAVSNGLVSWLDIPKKSLRVAFQILDTYRRRMVKRLNDACKTSVPVSFNAAYSYCSNMRVFEYHKTEDLTPIKSSLKVVAK